MSQRRSHSARAKSALIRAAVAGLIVFLSDPSALSANPVRRSTSDVNRHASHKSQPATLAHSSPDITAAIPPLKPQTASEDHEPLKPFFLPTATRARMRTCGQQWQNVKMSGQAADETWREFATKCLAEHDSEQKITH